MKKLMIAAAIVCAAVISQAATANWNWSTSGLTNSKKWSGTSGLLAENTAIYLFNAATISQDELLANFRDNTYTSLADAISVMQSSLDASSILKNKSIESPGGSGTINFYMAALVDGELFLSDSLPVVAQATSDTPIQFTGVSTVTAKDWTSDATFKFAGDGGKGGGWYAVPEPTSGLLLLLGVAGLALRRRRA